MPSTARQHLSIRVSPDGLARLDDLAVATGRTRSAALRALLGEALGDPAVVTRARARLAQPAAL